MRLNKKEIEALAKNGHKGVQSILAQTKQRPKSTKSRQNSKITALTQNRQYSLCATLAQQLNMIEAPDYRWDGHALGEYQFNPNRRWRLDFYFPDYKIAVEVEGGVQSHRRGFAQSKDGNTYHIQSRHLTPQGFEEDALKYFAAQLAGITVVRVTSKMVSDHRAIGMIIHLLESKGWKPKETQLISGFRSIISAKI